MFLDLAQDFYPDATRDNAGETLGLFYYDFLLRPGNDLTPLPNLSLGVYGDQDWEEGLRTFSTEHAAEGTSLGAEVRGRILPGKVTAMPFVSPRYVRKP